MYNGVYDQEQFAYMYDTLTKWLNVKINKGSLGKCLINKNINKIYIYGLGNIGKMAYDDIVTEQVEVKSFVDKKYKKYVDGYKGIQVIGIEKLGELDEDTYILVTPEYYFNDILNDLREGGIPLDKIITIPMVIV